MVFMEHKMSNSKDPGRNMSLPQGASQPDTKFTYYTYPHYFNSKLTVHQSIAYNYNKMY